MAIQSIPRSQGWGERLFSAPEGLSSAISELANAKIGQIQEQKRIDRNLNVLKGLGLPKEKAMQLAPISDEHLNTLLKGGSASTTPGLADINLLLGGSSAQQGNMPGMDYQSEMKKFEETLNPETVQSVKDYIASPEALKSHNPKELEMLKNYIDKKGGIAVSPAMKEMGYKGALPAAKPGEEQLTPEQSKKIKDLYQFIHPKTAKEKADFIQRVEEIKKEGRPEGKVTEESNKNTLPLFNQINDEAKAAEKSEKRLKRFNELINKGDLAHPLWASFVKTLQHGIPVLGVSLDLTSLMSQDSQEFEKLSTDFLKDAKAIFGSKMTEGELMQFLKTVPSLSQSNEGKVAVIRNMNEFNAAAKLRKDTMNKIIKEYKGRPENLEELTSERMGPELDKIVENIRANTPKEVPSTQSLPGSLARAIPKIIF